MSSNDSLGPEALALVRALAFRLEVREDRALRERREVPNADRPQAEVVEDRAVAAACSRVYGELREDLRGLLFNAADEAGAARTRRDVQRAGPAPGGEAIAFLDDPNCVVWAVYDGGVVAQDGITERNVGEFVRILTDRGYRVRLYRVSGPAFFAPTEPA